MNPSQTPRPDCPPTSRQAPSNLDAYIAPIKLRDLVQRAKVEDMGPAGIDLTTDCLIAPDQPGRAVLRARQPGHLAGTALLATIASVYDPAIALRVDIADGQAVDTDRVIAEFTGPLRSILAMERVALNFLTHLSGIATLTAQYVTAIANTKTQVYDTRKTLPGLRTLEKYAVACGGGHNHRSGLYDAVLVKDNHIAHLSPQQLGPALAAGLQKARSHTPPPQFVEVEIDSIEQLRAVLDGPQASLIDVVLLDNMTESLLRKSVTIRDTLAPDVQLEASGGVRLNTVTQIARTGVDRISIGEITSGAPPLDLGLDIS